jgi:integrase/recombinase XerD
MHDIEKLTQYLTAINSSQQPADLGLKDLQLFVKWINELGMGQTSQFTYHFWH